MTWVSRVTKLLQSFVKETTRGPKVSHKNYDKNKAGFHLTPKSLCLCSIFAAFSTQYKFSGKSLLRATKGDFPENLHRAVYVIINKRSFESLIRFDLILER